MSDKIVANEVVVKATAALQKEIDEELGAPDPDEEKAKALFLGEPKHVPSEEAIKKGLGID